MISTLISTGMSILGSTGVFDSETTETKVDYTQFGNFAEAGKTIGAVSGTTSTEEDVVTKNTGISDALTMGGSILGSLSSSLDSMDSSMRANGSTGITSPHAANKANKAEAGRRATTAPTSSMAPVSTQSNVKPTLMNPRASTGINRMTPASINSVGNNVSILGLGGTQEDYRKYNR